MFATTNQTKLVPISGVAMAATFGLFYLMQSLVASDDLDFAEPRPPIRLDVNIGDIEVRPAREIERVTPPPEPEPQPEVEVDRSASFDGFNFEVGPAPKPYINSTGTTFKLGVSDGERIPIVRVNPTYPRRALIDGVEGWVILDFTVSEMGTVENAVVIDANPKGYFERAALKAIQKFKYKPTVVDGQPRASRGQFRMTFELTQTQ
ncbi:energy transducer TonB [Kordiimonas lacus]|uniref:Protein TonB n=1 Tax=Kordiimonas lacus TaxID=637679 RepID=A0A1G6XWD0_9PROT|nr:energy transducer TonB [Kordiimonas lacus]SDD81676.1 protein TonB [Kordiimonas lacus]